MELNPRLIAFLKHEMEKIKDNRDRPQEDREHASSVLGCIEGEIEWAESQHYTDETLTLDADELFSKIQKSLTVSSGGGLLSTLPRCSPIWLDTRRVETHVAHCTVVGWL